MYRYGLIQLRIWPCDDGVAQELLDEGQELWQPPSALFRQLRISRKEFVQVLILCWFSKLNWWTFLNLTQTYLLASPGS